MNFIKSLMKKYKVYKQKKEVVSMMQFLEEVGKIANEHGEKFYAVYLEITHLSSGRIEIRYRGYINPSVSSEQLNTPQECLEKLREHYEKPVQQVIPADIII